MWRDLSRFAALATDLEHYTVPFCDIVRVWPSEPDRPLDSEGRRQWIADWDDLDGVYRPEHNTKPGQSCNDGHPVGYRRVQDFFCTAQAMRESWDGPVVFLDREPSVPRPHRAPLEDAEVRSDQVATFDGHAERLLLPDAEVFADAVGHLREAGGPHDRRELLADWWRRYDAKVWRFAHRDACDGAVLWNVGA